MPDSTPDSTPAKTRRLTPLVVVMAATAAVTFGITALLVNIFEHKQEARTPFVRLAEVTEISTDPEPWGMNWPYQYDTYRRTVDQEHTEFGGSSAMTQSKLDSQPWLKRLYAGYAFSIDYRELRGHAYMLYDQEVTERVTKRTQSGACLHCHASITPTYRRLGLESMGEKVSVEALAADFNWPAVMEGFRVASTMDYATAHAELERTPDGTPHGDPNDPHQLSDAHPVSCIDCHDPDSMQLRITRPGFINGIAALARSDDAVPHLPSVERWRRGNQSQDYDPNIDASRREMRSFVCGQCHVEYYCASKETLFFPWENGLKVEQIEETFDNHVFPDGTPFSDYIHGETGAITYKAQHPEFELWSQGIHARSGVSCTDCHMPYERQGAMKVSSHWVRSPMLSLSNSCQTCHRVEADELVEKVEAIQNRTRGLIDRAAQAMTDMLDAIHAAQASGISAADLAGLHDLQRKAMWRLDFISSENSAGFHADQEAARILAESIDYSRQAQAMAAILRAPPAPAMDERKSEVQGVTDRRNRPGGI